MYFVRNTNLGMTTEDEKKSTLHGGVLLSNCVYEFFFFHFVHIEELPLFYSSTVGRLSLSFLSLFLYQIPFHFFFLLFFLRAWLVLHFFGDWEYIHQTARRSKASCFLFLQ